MPALAPIPPRVLKDVLVRDGWSIYDEDSYNWILTKGNQILPPVPKRGGVVAMEVHEHLLGAAGIPLDRYFKLLKEIGYSHYN